MLTKQQSGDETKRQDDKLSLEVGARCTVFYKAAGTLKQYEVKKATFEVQYFFTFEEWQVREGVLQDLLVCSFLSACM